MKFRTGLVMHNLVPITVYEQRLAQAVGFSTLMGCNLNDESVRKILKTQLRYEISNGSCTDEGSVDCTTVHTKTTLGQRNV